MPSEAFQAVRVSVSAEGTEQRETMMLVEVRSERLASMAPGSVHPDGETVAWASGGEPAAIDAGELRQAVLNLAEFVFQDLNLSAEGWTKSWVKSAASRMTAPEFPAQRPMDRVVEALRARGGTLKPRGNGYIATCPAHQDTHPSLSIDETMDGTVLIKCFTGCSPQAVATAMGLKLRDLFPARPAPPSISVAAPNEWPIPRPLCDGPTPPAFPIEAAFPGDLSPLRDFVLAVAEQLQVPIDLPAMVLLPATSVSMAQKFEVQLRLGWREVSATWTLSLLGSGERKSGTFSIMVNPIIEWERDEAERLKDLIAETSERRRIAEKRLAEQRKKAAKADEDTVAEETALAIKMALQLKEMPVVRAPVIYTSDATTEALGSMLVENHERGMVASPEGDALDVMMGRYSERAQPNMGIWLKGHAGDSERIIRKSREAEFITRPALSVGMVVQPEAVRGLFASRAAKGRGLLARFLPSAPLSMLGHRKTGGSAAPIPAQLMAVYRSTLRRLLNIPIDPHSGPKIITLGDEARAMLDDFEAKVESQLGKRGCLGERKDWGGKLCGAVGRISLALYGLRLGLHPDRAGDQIDTTIMHAALSWAPYLIEHEGIVAGVAGADKDVAIAERILSWLRRTGSESFCRREAYEAVRCTLVQKAEDVDGAMGLLEELEYLRQFDPPLSGKGGRPKGKMYQVNPRWDREAA